MGRRGRLPDAVKHRFEEILFSPSGFAKFKRMMAATTKEDAFLKYFQECMDRKYGKAADIMDIDINDTTARPTTEQLNEALRCLKNNSDGDGMAKTE